MKSLQIAWGVCAALFAVVLWHLLNHKAMLRHLQMCLAFNAADLLEFPTERAFKDHARRHRTTKSQKGTA
jgi:hypothetical protein